MSGMTPWKWDMNDDEKDKEQLIRELNRLRRRMIRLKVTEIRYKRAKKLLKKTKEKYKDTLCLNIALAKLYKKSSANGRS